MLSADGGSGGTNWSAMDVPAMWALVANQDTTAHYKRLTGWQKSYELLLEHLSQVQNYRANLAAAWPPEKSPAAAAYVAQLDDLITHLRKTYDAAISNHTAFAGATLSLSLSRGDLKKIYDEYTTNQTKLEAFNAKPKPVQYGKVPVLPPKPPVAMARQEQLNNQARLLMSKLSTDLAQAQASLTAPPTFVPPQLIDDHKTLLGAPNHTGSIVPPMVPVDSSAGPAISHGKSGHLAVGSTHTAELPPATSPAGGARQPGLVLGGVNPHLAAPIQPPMPSLTSPGSGPLPNVINQSPILPTAPPLTPKLPQASRAVRNFQGEGIERTIGASSVGGVRAMPPGGVIGGTPGVGIGRPTMGRSSPQRVNPVGGVIRSSGTEAGSSIRGSSGTAQQVTGVGGRAGRRGKSDESTSWDPDNPWDTAEGVAPVVLPVTEQRVDPGPAIGLD